MEKGLSRGWTPEVEKRFSERIGACRSFAEKQLIMGMRDLLKYDHRTKAAKRARAQARLRLITASDEDLKELAKLEARIGHPFPGWTAAERLLKLELARAMLRKKGIKRGELTCR